MAGANLKSNNRLRSFQLFWRYLILGGVGTDRNRLGRPRQGRFPTFLWKNGVPASNTAADAPDRRGQVCIDLLNDDVYLCTAFTNTTTHTWTKISD